MPMPEDIGYFRKSHERRRFELISRLVPENGITSVLDVGCGTGWLSGMLSDRGFRVIATDLGFDSLRRASARFQEQGRRVSFVCGDVYGLPFADDGFDAVVASEILEHLDSPGEALKELVRVVKPGGSIVISTPYRERIVYTLCIHCNKRTPVNAHLNSFDDDTMERMLVGAGCTVVKRVTFINRIAERIGFAGLTSFMPYTLWRLIDRIVCALFKRQAFMAVRAVKND